MLIRSRLLFLVPIAALIGCGSSPSNPSSTNNSNTPATYNFNGNWNGFSNYNGGLQNYEPFLNLGGPLQVSSGVVTGTLIASTPYSSSDPNLCAAVNTPLAVTGTLNDSHELTLTFPISGGMGTLIAPLANDPQTYTYGSWQINGGTCAMSVTPMWINGTPSIPATPTSPVPITAALSGNWSASANYSPNGYGSTLLVAGFGGALQFSNGVVSGTINAVPGIVDPACSSVIASGLPVTGTLDAANNLTLTAPVGGGTATISATLGPIPQTLAGGSYQIVGGSCATPATPMTIAQYAPITGTYIGTFNEPDQSTFSTGNVPVAGTTIAVTAVLTQSTTANSNGQFPITGTVNITGTCTDSTTFSGFVSGNTVTSISGLDFTSYFFGPTATSSSFTEFFVSAATDINCLKVYQGTLTRK